MHTTECAANAESVEEYLIMEFVQTSMNIHLAKMIEGRIAMSDLIEQLKKSEELCKDTYSESTIITKLTLRRIISALEESAKEPQNSESDLISRKKLIEDVEILKNQIYSLTKYIIRYTPTKCDNVNAILRKCGNIRAEIDSFQKGYNQPQVQPICCGCTYDYENGYLDARLKADGWTKQPIVRSKDELIDVLVHVDCDNCPVRNHCMGCFHTTDKECREHLSDWLTGKEV